MVADGFSQHRSVNSFTDTFSTKSGADDYDHFSRITNNDSSSANKSQESSQAENKRFEKDLKSRHRTACKEMDGGKYKSAIQLFEGILADLLTRYDMNHERIGTALHNIAVANLRANELSGAKDAIEEAFRIRKAALGAMHPQVGDSLVEFGIILMALKENDRALKVFLEALEVREEGMTNAKEGQERHKAQLYLAKVLHNLGCVYTELDQLDAAQDTYNKALEQQKAAFGEWNGNLNSKSDSTKPGFLTMASTICNLASIELERGNHHRAIAFLNDSLEIQKVLLEADNKLILSTMQSIAYVYCLQSQYSKAKDIYMEIAKLQQESYVAHAKRGWNTSIKSLIYCQLRTFDFESAFDNLRKLEDVLSEQAQTSGGTDPKRDLQTTHELMGEVNFQLAKLPSITEYTQRLLVGQGCGLCECEAGEFRDAIDAEPWFPKRPTKGSKMTGHRMSYA